ncbi:MULTISPECIES: low affinity iron permease family protein [Chitinophagaceae]
MQKSNKKSLHAYFEKYSGKVTCWAGSPAAFMIAFITILVWLICGPVFHYSDTWQLLINTGTTIITFLMVFLIQQSQNKDTRALHIKLDGLISANQNADNKLINIEELDEEDLLKMKEYYTEIVEKLDKAGSKEKKV